MFTGDLYIPVHILYYRDLPNKAKFLYGAIVTSSLTDGFCSDTDQELSKIIQATARTVKKHISALEKHGLITQKKTETGRRLYPNKEVVDSINESLKEGN